MEGASRNPRGVMGSGARESTHLYCWDLIRPGNCWERQPLLERGAAWQSVSVTAAGSAQWGGLAWHDVPSAFNPADKSLPPTKTSTSSTANLTVLSTNTTLELIFLSLQASRSCTQTNSFYSLLHTPFPLTDINTHPHKLSLLVLSYYLTEHQQIFCSVPSSQWCEWLSRWI